MNKIIDFWNRHESKSKYVGPDAVKIDDQKIQVGAEDMAERKSPVTEPVRDNDVVNKNRNAERSLVVRELSKPEFNNVIRYILRGTQDAARSIREITFENVKRLKLKRNMAKAITKTPKGSDQADSGTLVRWMRDIQITDKISVRQLIALDATCVYRMK